RGQEFILKVHQEMKPDLHSGDVRPRKNSAVVSVTEECASGSEDDQDSGREEDLK
ncbi:hypothetical protein HispidOSU_016260, partial [Sigmodon hispidus]